jgi:hypothetical protein
VAVEQEGCAGKQTGVHAHAFARIDLDDHETFPVPPIPLRFRFELLQETLLEFQNLFYIHVGKQGMSCGNGCVGEKDILEFVVTGGNDGGALVDLRGIEQVEYGEALDGEDPVHAFEAESALAIQEVRNVCLFESGLLGEAEAGESALLNALPKSVSEVFLQDSEFHGLEYSTAIIAMR